jgi:pyruvate dehydrogenase E1 component beta subunit
MSRKSYRRAIGEALHQEMRRDPRVIVLGIDVGGGQGGTGATGEVGGVLGVTRGLFAEFGPTRVIDTPISESAIIGAASGAAVAGLRPVAELMFVDFVGVCFDQIYNQAAKFRYMFGGKAKTPMVIRTMAGAGFRAGAQHSQTLAPLFTMVPGLKVVMPSNAYDAKGLLIEAIRDDDPVIFLESKVLYDTEAEVPDEAYRIPFGEANVAREGADVTIVAFAAMVPRALAAAEALAKEGLSAEVIDPRTSSPLDAETILESVEKTGRLVVVDESPPRCSLAADVAALVAEEGFASLKAPIVKVTCPHTPVPFAPVLEDAYVPTTARIEMAARGLMRRIAPAGSVKATLAER